MHAPDLGQLDAAAGEVQGLAVVPHHQIARPPCVMVDEIAIVDMGEQLVEQGLGLVIIHVHNADGEARAHEQRLPTGVGMGADQRVEGIGGRALGVIFGSISVAGGARHARVAHAVEAVDADQPVDTGLHRIGQCLIGGSHVDPFRVAADLGHLDRLQDGIGGGPVDIGMVGMPIAAGVGDADILAVDYFGGQDQHLGLVRHLVFRIYVVLDFAEAPGEIGLRRGAQRLVAHNHDHIIVHGIAKPGKSFLVEGGGVYARDLGAELIRQWRYLHFRHAGPSLSDFIRYLIEAAALN